MASPTQFNPTRRTVLLAAGVALATPGLVLGRSAITVLAAASLKPALDEIAADWPEDIGLSYGGSGTLARQAAFGAPADLVMLAAQDWMDWLAGQGVLDGAPVSVATNRLVLAGPPGAPPVDLDATAIADRLGQGGRFAMGDPASVPAGRYGQQALETLGLWSDLRTRAILAENVRAALAYVARGDVGLGLVYGSDVIGADVAQVAAIPARAHQPIRYPAARLIGARHEARAFLDHVAASGAVFARHGFAA